MSEANKNLVRRVIEEIWTGGNLDLIDELYAEDFERFGYTPEEKKPVVTPPVLPETFAKARERELARRATFSYRWNDRLNRWRKKLL